MRGRHLLLFFSLVCYGVPLLAQNELQARAVREYAERFSGQLYQGKLYGGYPASVAGHQSFRNLGIVEGSSIVVNGVRYHEVPLMFDLVRNQLVTRHPIHAVNIVLAGANVSSFTIDDHVFVYLDASEKGLPPGFYQQIAESATVSCYASWTKVYRERTRGTRLLREFTGDVTYYLLRKGHDSAYRNIRSQGALLRSFKEHRRQLRREWRPTPARLHKNCPKRKPPPPRAQYRW